MVDLSEMANAIAAGLRRSEPERLATFRIADGITVKGDARLLMVVMENLLGNAWKYTGKKETPVIEFGMTEVDGRLTCFVRDNGAGFDMAKADKLFVPFQRLHDRTEFTGFGIGLATVQRIIQRHGGQDLGRRGTGQRSDVLLYPSISRCKVQKVRGLQVRF